MLGEDRDHTALGGNIEPVQAGVNVKYVRLVANRGAPEHALGLEVENEQRCIPVAGHKGEPPRRVEVQPVVVLTARQRVAPSDPFSLRVDHDQLVSSLHIDQDPAVAGVVLDVAGAATDADRGEPPSTAGVGDDHGATRFVGDEHLLVDRVVGDPVRIAAGRDAAEDGARSFVDCHQLACVGGGGEDAADARRDEDAVHAR